MRVEVGLDLLGARWVVGAGADEGEEEELEVVEVRV